MTFLCTYTHTILSTDFQIIHNIPQFQILIIHSPNYAISNKLCKLHYPFFKKNLYRIYDNVKAKEVQRNLRETRMQKLEDKIKHVKKVNLRCLLLHEVSLSTNRFAYQSFEQFESTLLLQMPNHLLAHF